MARIIPLTLLVAALATAVFAHQGVKNPAVMARMENMSGMQNAMKRLGAMAKQEQAFDAAEAAAQADIIDRLAGEVLQRFEAREDDPKSEAKLEIWENWDDFRKKAERLERVAEPVQFNDVVQLQAWMGELQGACKACHDLYTE